MLGKMARGVKDGALSMSAKSWLNDKFHDYGSVQECRIDTGANSAAVTALLTGERESITVTLKRYELQHEAGETYIVLHEFHSSRAWIGKLLSRLFSGKRHKLPSAVSKLL